MPVRTVLPARRRRARRARRRPVRCQPLLFIGWDLRRRRRCTAGVTRGSPALSHCLFPAPARLIATPDPGHWLWMVARHLQACHGHRPGPLLMRGRYRSPLLQLSLLSAPLAGENPRPKIVVPLSVFGTVLAVPHMLASRSACSTGCVSSPQT